MSEDILHTLEMKIQQLEHTIRDMGIINRRLQRENNRLSELVTSLQTKGKNDENK